MEQLFFGEVEQQIFAAMLDENVNQNEIAIAKRNQKQASSWPPPGSTGPRHVTGRTVSESLDATKDTWK